MFWNSPSLNQAWGYAPILKKFSGLEQIPEINHKYIERIAEKLALRAQQMMRLNSLQQYLVHAPVTLATGESGTMWVQVFAGAVGVPIITARLELRRVPVEEEEDESFGLFYFCHEHDDATVTRHVLYYGKNGWSVRGAGVSCEIPEDRDSFCLFWTGNGEEDVAVFCGEGIYGRSGKKLADALWDTVGRVYMTCFVDGLLTAFASNGVYTFIGDGEPVLSAPRIYIDYVNQNGTEGAYDTGSELVTYSLSRSDNIVTPGSETTIATWGGSWVYRPNEGSYETIEDPANSPVTEEVCEETEGCSINPTICYESYLLEEQRGTGDITIVKNGRDRTRPMGDFLGYRKNTLEYATQKGSDFQDSIATFPQPIRTRDVTTAYGGWECYYFGPGTAPIWVLGTRHEVYETVAQGRSDVGEIFSESWYQWPSFQKTQLLTKRLWNDTGTTPHSTWSADGTQENEYADWVGIPSPPQFGIDGPVEGWTYTTDGGTDNVNESSQAIDSTCVGEIPSLDLYLWDEWEGLSTVSRNDNPVAYIGTSLYHKGEKIFSIPVENTEGESWTLLSSAFNYNGQAIMLLENDGTYLFLGYAQGRVTDLTAMIQIAQFPPSGDDPLFNLLPISVGVKE